MAEIRTSAERARLMHAELDAIVVQSEIDATDAEALRQAVLDALDIFEQADQLDARARGIRKEATLARAAKEMAARLQQLHRVRVSEVEL